MALKITVDKPEFNLRETLTRLDTERIPYEKMPVGSVIQVQKHQLVGSVKSTLPVVPIKTVDYLLIFILNLQIVVFW